ncbi:MAG: conserved phage C-terminal domain-containing protein [Candidatus Cloacimonetes bacterium]|nr:conserved phage C-terminal domain-containing protein [Candidatus Cloacimonadota bacterium]
MSFPRKLYDEVTRLFGRELVDGRIKRLLLRLKHRDGGKSEGSVARIIADLNARTGFSYRLTSAATQKLLKALLADHPVEDILRVHEAKCKEWKGSREMRKHLCPGTLYRKSNFERYLETLDAQSSERSLKGEW